MVRTEYKSWLIDLCILTAAIGVFYFLWLGSYPLFTPDEGRYSEIAREMLSTGNYITPRVNGIIFFDKPIFHYWLQILSMSLLGINEWAARTPPALFGLFGCLGVYTSGRTLFDRQTGILAAILLATSPLYFVSAHYANLDLEVSILISMSLLAFITATTERDQPNTSLLLLSYAFASFAALTKGLMGIVFPGIIICLWIALTQQWRLLLKIKLPYGICLFLIITLPWYLLVQSDNPLFFQYFIINQQVERFLSHGEYNNPFPVWFYLPVILVGMLPWSLWLIQALYINLKAVISSVKVSNQLSFLLIWFFFILVFFSIPQAKIVTYILPLFPPAVLLIAYSFTHRNIPSWQQPSIRTISLLVILNLIGLLTITHFGEHWNRDSNRSAAIRLKNTVSPTSRMVFYHSYEQDIPFYLQRILPIVSDWNDPNIPKKDNWQRELWYGKAFEPHNPQFLDEKTFWNQWNNHEIDYVILKEKNLSSFNSHTKNYHIMQINKELHLITH